MNHGYHESLVFPAQRRNGAHKVVQRKPTKKRNTNQTVETTTWNAFVFVLSFSFTESVFWVTVWWLFIFCILHLKFRDVVGGFTQKISVTSHSFWPSQIPLRVTHPLTMGGKHMDLKMAEVSQRQSGHKRGKQNMWPKWFRRHHDSHLEPCDCSPDSARKRKRSFQHAVCSSRWICFNFNWEILAKRNHLY